MICKVWYVTYINSPDSGSDNILKCMPHLRDRIRVQTPDGEHYVFKCMKYKQEYINALGEPRFKFPVRSCFEQGKSMFSTLPEDMKQKAYDDHFEMHAEYLGEWDFGTWLLSDKQN